MRALRLILAAAVAWCFSFTAVLAQDDDKSFLTRKIQDALSGGGRTVSIDGFAGALSSAASFDRMTIADENGIWLSLEDVVLVWNRSALLRGRLEVEQLTAERLDIPRLPVSTEAPLPDAEAKPFSLPDLPVSIEIADFSVDQINLGAPLLGETVQMTVKANARLTDDVANVDFLAQRTDSKAGEFQIKASLERSDNILDLLLKLKEEEAGIAARLLNLPGQPAVEMSIAGQGPLNDFKSDVIVASDGQERLAGEITLGTQASRRTSSAPDYRIQADIGGDITTLLAPRYRDFFGTDVRLKLDALREDTGAIEVSDFALTAQAAQLQGKMTLNQDKWPTFIDITGTVANPDGTPILLPAGGDGTTVEKVDLRVDYNAGEGEAFIANFDIVALSTGGLKIAQTTLGLDGTLQGNLGSVGQFLGDMTITAQGLELTDPASGEAIGDKVTGRANINYIEGQPIRISDLDISGADYGLTGKVIVNGPESGLLTRLDARLETADLSRFSALVGRELDGQTDLAVKGTITPLSGGFDLVATGSALDLRLGIEQADAVLAGRTQLRLEAMRNEDGTFLRDLVLENDALSLNASAELRKDDSEAQSRFELNDIGMVLPQYSGPVTVTATATQDTRGWSVDAATDGPYGTTLTAMGLATGPNASLTFTADVPNVKPFVPSVDGPVKANGTLRRSPVGWRLNTTATGPDDISAMLNGSVTPTLDLQFDMTVPELNPLVPQFNGPLKAEGRLRQTNDGYYIDANVDGPYEVQANLEGLATGPEMALTFDMSVPDLQPLVPSISGPLTAKGVARQTESGIAIKADATGPYGAHAMVEGLATGPEMALSFDLSVPDLRPLVPSISGALMAKGVARQTESGIAIRADATGPHGARAMVEGLATGPEMALSFDVSVPDLRPLVPSISGPLNANGVARQTGSGIAINAKATGPHGARAMVEGLATGPEMALSFDVSVPDIEPLVPGLSGPLTAEGVARQATSGILINANATGPFGARAMVEGLATGPDMALTFDVSVPDLQPLVPSVSGPLKAQGVARQTRSGISIDTSVTGPYGARAMVEGIATGPDMQLTFDISVPNVNPLVPSVSGPLAAKGVVRQTAAGIAIDTNATGPYSSRGSVKGVVTGPDAAVDFGVFLPNIGVFVDKVDGPLRVQGSARKEGTRWLVNTSADGPSGTQAAVSGVVGGDGTLNLDINGTVPLGLSRPFLAPRNLQGQARFDLTVNGPATLSSLNGTIRTSNASLSAPNLRFALTGIDANVQLGGNRATLDVTGNASNGGRLRVGGAVALTPSLPADISIALQDIVLIDPRLYRTSLSGDLRLSGPLAGRARIAGLINVGETTVNVPSTGLTSIGDIPPITHVNAPADVTTTRAKAGLTGAQAADDPGTGTSGPGFGLDLRINAPNRIFVRGRGLDAELGGALTLTGTTSRIISAGRLELIRGRLDILGKRFDLDEGSVQFQGDLIPYLRFVSSTNTKTGEVRVIVLGRANEPEVIFESTPEAPQDEVLAQLLFGSNIADISAFQALQLASAVATLAGRGGGGIIANLREGFGLDDLDVTTTDDGATALRLGKYLSENVYTDVTASSDGEAEVSLNLDITTNLKGKATLGSDGDSSFGIFFEKDY